MLTMILGFISSIFLTSAQHFYSIPSVSILDSFAQDLSSSALSFSVLSVESTSGSFTYASSLDYNLALTLTESGNTSGSQVLSSFGNQFYICSFVSDSSVQLRSYGASVTSSAYIGSFARTIDTGGNLTTAGTYNYLVTASNGESYVSTSGSTSDTIFVKKAYLVPVNSASGTSSGSYSGGASGSVSGSASESGSGSFSSTTSSFLVSDYIYVPLLIPFTYTPTYNPNITSLHGNCFALLDFSGLYLSVDGMYTPSLFVSIATNDNRLVFSPVEPSHTNSVTSDTTLRLYFDIDHFSMNLSPPYSFNMWIILKIPVFPRTSSIFVHTPTSVHFNVFATYDSDITLDALYNQLITAQGNSSKQLDSANKTLGNSITQADSQEQKALDAVSGFTTLDYSAPVAAITAYSSELTIFASTVKTLMDSISPLKFLVSLGLLLTFLSILFGIFKHQKRGGDG